MVGRRSLEDKCSVVDRETLRAFVEVVEVVADSLCRFPLEVARTLRPYGSRLHAAGTVSCLRTVGSRDRDDNSSPRSFNPLPKNHENQLADRVA